MPMMQLPFASRAKALFFASRGQARFVASRAVALGLVAALLGASAPAPQPARLPAPPGPPNGTYVYALSRNGADQGTTTVVVYRRDDVREIEVDEAASLGAARAHALASYRYDDLSPASFVTTYQAPFLRSSPIGAARRNGIENAFYDQSTVRYRVAGTDVTATVDGSPALPAAPPVPHASDAPKTRYVLDAPFMASVLMLPTFRHRTGASQLAPVGVAFGAAHDLVTTPMRLVRATPRAPKTPKTDDALQIDGVATIWFNRGNGIVDEAHFDAVNIDARLVSYARPARPAPFLPAATPTPEPRLPAAETTLTSEDGTTLDGVVDMPPGVKRPVPIVALIPPGPSAGRNFGGDGPNPMFPDLTRILASRGYAVLRFDTRGVGKSTGSSQSETWEQSLADTLAAIQAAAETDGVDPKRIYVMGYGSGADLALAASAQTDVPIAGVVALAPTVVPYRTCGRQLAEAGASTPAEKAKADALFDKTAGHISDEPANDEIDGRRIDRNDGSWMKTAYGHDPSALAVRTKAPLFVLHPGIPICNETHDQVESYDDRLRAADARATIVAANDLTQVFGGRYDADADIDTEAFFPYRFDPSTAGAIVDWLDSPKTASGVHGFDTGPARRGAPPPPPPALGGGGNGADSGMPNPHPPQAPALPGQPGLPSTLATPTPTPAPATAAPAPATPAPGPAPAAPLPAATASPPA
jgi:alpha/beta superfamily hydrolase